jgi:hypothetical protein
MLLFYFCGIIYSGDSMSLEEMYKLSIKELNEYLSNNTTYGFVGNDGKTYVSDSDISENFSEQYRLRSGEDILLDGVGVCWDYVEVERLYFDYHKIPYKTIFLDYYGPESRPSHAFLMYQEDNRWIWFESCFIRGLHEHSTEEGVINDVKDTWLKYSESISLMEELKMFEFTKPKVGLRQYEYGAFVESGKRIDTLYYNKNNKKQKK